MLKKRLPVRNLDIDFVKNFLKYTKYSSFWQKKIYSELIGDTKEEVFTSICFYDKNGYYEPKDVHMSVIHIFAFVILEDDELFEMFVSSYCRSLSNVTGLCSAIMDLIWNDYITFPLTGYSERLE